MLVTDLIRCLTVANTAYTMHQLHQHFAMIHLLWKKHCSDMMHSLQVVQKCLMVSCTCKLGSHPGSIWSQKPASRPDKLSPPIQVIGCAQTYLHAVSPGYGLIHSCNLTGLLPKICSTLRLLRQQTLTKASSCPSKSHGEWLLELSTRFAHYCQ